MRQLRTAVYSDLMATRRAQPVDVPPKECRPRRTGLSERERQIVALIKEGRSNKAIASEIGLTPGTVKQYIFHGVFPKLGATNRYEVIVWAMKHPEQLVDICPCRVRTEQVIPQAQNVPSSLGAATENVAPDYSEMA